MAKSETESELAATRAQKGRLRRVVWSRIQEAGVGRFPGIQGRIPNFQGAEQAAERLAELPEWRKAKRIKSNPDSPQLPARKRALREGKIVYMAVPRLREKACFIELDPERLSRPSRAASIKGAFELGRQVTIDEMEAIDLVLCGSVAVTREGLRLGKGGGYSDLEFALLVESGKVQRGIPIVTTVHPVQYLDALPVTEHDFALDLIVTSDETIRCSPQHPRPKGIYWDLLDREKLDGIPVLRELGRKRPKKHK